MRAKAPPGDKRAAFGEGPWVDEPDFLDLEIEGYPAIVRRSHWGTLCGYVALPPGHPWFGREPPSRELSEVSVHGGITVAFGGKHSDDDPRMWWWIGFDCAHAWDFNPLLSAARCTYAEAPEHDFREYRTIDFVLSEITRLAAQAAAAHPRLKG